MQHLRLPTEELKTLFEKNDKDEIVVYVYLNFNAVYKEQSVKIKNRTINLKVGQLATSERFLGKTLKIDKSKIRRTLKFLESKQFISINNFEACSIISIISKLADIHRTTTSPYKSTSYSSCRTTYEPHIELASEPPSEPLLLHTNQQVIESVEPPSEPPVCKQGEPSDRSLLANTVLIARKKEEKEELDRKKDNNASAANNKDLVIGVEVLEAAEEALSSISQKDDLKDKKISLKQSQERILKNKGFSSVIDFNWISDLKQQRLAAEA